MRRCLSIITFFLFAAAPATGFEVPGDAPITIGGRFLTHVETDHSSSPFPWDHISRSPVDFTRLMLDLQAGRERYGVLYLKGEGTWRFSEDRRGRVPFSFAQGDYLFERRSPDWRYRVRAFANERRYFTGEMGNRLLDDDFVSRYETHWGGRVTGDAGRVRWSLLAAGLESAAGTTRGIGHAEAGWFATHVQASMGYLHDLPAADSLADHGILKGEISAFYRRASLVLSYQQAATDGDFSGNAAPDRSGVTGMLPENSAAFAELRLRGARLRDWGTFSVWGRYRAFGERFANDLAPGQPASTTGSVGAYFRHSSYATEGRLVYRRQERYRFADTRVEHVELHAHAFFLKGYEALVRGAVGERRDATGTRAENYILGSVRRNLRKFLGGAYLYVGDDEFGALSLRAAGELRVNVNARSAVYARLVTNQDATSSDALYVRLEFRPLVHLFATLSYGRRYIGDGPYVLEDTDIGRTGPTDNVYTLTVRGDF